GVAGVGEELANELLLARVGLAVGRGQDPQAARESFYFLGIEDAVRHAARILHPQKACAHGRKPWAHFDSTSTSTSAARIRTERRLEQKLRRRGLARARAVRTARRRGSRTRARRAGCVGGPGRIRSR